MPPSITLLPSLLLLLLLPSLPPPTLASCPPPSSTSASLIPLSLLPLHSPLLADPTSQKIYSSHPSTIHIGPLEFTLPAAILGAAAVLDVDGDGHDDVVAVDTVGDVWIIGKGDRHAARRLGNVATLGGGEEEDDEEEEEEDWVKEGGAKAEGRRKLQGEDFEDADGYDDVFAPDDDSPSSSSSTSSSPNLHVFSSPVLARSEEGPRLLLAYTDLEDDVSTYLM